MKSMDEPPALGRCLLGGLFAGIITALIVVVFNVVYRRAVDLSAYEIVMPVSIFMIFPLFNLVAGGVYFLFLGHIKRGPQLFAIVVLSIMALSIVITALSGRRADHTVEEFRGLLLGMELIEGIVAAFLIPFFVRHPGLYLTPGEISDKE
jgi:hypothetical protein